MPRVIGRACPGCGNRLPDRPTGRPPTYCSTACRQRAHRARRRAAEATGQARAALLRAQALEREAAGDLAELSRLLGHGLDLFLREDPGGEAWRTAIPTGWESAVAEAADRLAGRARQIAAALREHARAAGEQYRALRTAGIEPGRPFPPADERPRPRTAAAAADGANVVDEGQAADVGVGIDRDELFDIVDDLLILADRGELGEALAAALEAPLDRLAEVFEAAAGDGPIEDLAAAAAAVRRTAQEVPDAPPLAAALIARLDAVLGPVRGVEARMRLWASQARAERPTGGVGGAGGQGVAGVT